MEKGWEDEKEYEDFNDYKDAITKAFNDLGIGAKVVSVTKAFKITFDVPMLENTIRFSTKVNKCSITTKMETMFKITDKAGV